MRKGSFTGKKFADYVHGHVCDYESALYVVNKLDRRALVKDYAEKFESFFTLSRIA